MRYLVAVVVALMFVIPVPALAQFGDSGQIDVVDPVSDAGPVPYATLVTEELGLEFEAPITYSGIGTGGGASIVVPSLPSINIPGLPRLPVKTVNLEYPAGTMVEDVRIAHDGPDSYIISGELELAPPVIAIGPFGSLGPVPIEEYYDGGRFPADWYTYDVRRGLSSDGEPTIFVNVFIYPVSTEAMIGGYKVSYLTNVDLDVVYSPVAETDGPSSRQDGDSYDLLIICPGGFSDELESLASHKKETGMDTIVVSLAEIYNGDHFTAQGDDDQEKIKYFIKDALESWGISYVLIGGDVDEVPTRHAEIYDGFDDDGSWYADGHWVPTDQYYADIYDGQNNFDDWDGNNNNVYGQWTGGSSGYSLDDPDYYTDVYIGRLPASTSTELNNMIAKVINYENSTDWSWFFEAGLAGLDTFASDPSGIPEGEYAMDKIGQKLSPVGFSLTKLYETQGTLSGNAIVSTVNGGVGVMTMAGHGSPDAWGSESALYFSNNLIGSMNNGVKLPLGSQSACSTGSFDNEDPVHYPGWNNPESMAERFVLESDGGYITDVGSSRVAYGAWGTMTADYNSDFFNILYWTALADGHGTPGKMLDKTRSDYMDRHGTTWVGDYKHMSAYNLFGDPSVAIGGIGIQMETDAGTPEIKPGEQATYNFTVKNIGIWDMAASMDREILTDGWVATLDTDVLNLASGTEQNVTMTVTAPDDALANEVGDFKVIATSDFNDRSASVFVDAKVKQVYGMGFFADKNERPALPGEDVQFNLTVKNKGNGPDGAAVSASDIPAGWGMHLDANHLDLSPYGSSKTKVTLSLPDQVLAGSYWFNVTAVLDGASVTKKRTLRVDVEPIYDVDMVCVVCDAKVDPGAKTTLSVNMTNLGNLPDNVTLAATVPDGWSLNIPVSVHTIGAFSFQEAAIEVTPANKALAGKYMVKAMASIDEKTVEVDLEVTVNRIYGIELVVDVDSLTVEGGMEATFGADVRNTGNGPDQVDVSCLRAPPGWAAQGDVQSFRVEAYSTYRLKFFVTTTFDSLAGDYSADMKVQIQDKPDHSDEVTLFVRIAERIEGSASLRTTSDSAYPGTSFMNTVTFVNMGNVFENVSLETGEGDDNFSIRALDPKMTVPPGTEGEVAFIVLVPSKALAGLHRYEVLVNRDKGPTIILTGEVDVEQVFRFDIKVEEGSMDVARGEKIIRKVTVTNTGNGDDTFLVEIIGETRAWTSMTERNFTLEPEKSWTIYVSITPPNNAAPEYHEVFVDVTSKCGSTKEEVVGYRITAPDEEVTVGTTVGSFFPWIIVLIVIFFAIGRAVAELRGRSDRERYR